MKRYKTIQIEYLDKFYKSTVHRNLPIISPNLKDKEWLLITHTEVYKNILGKNNKSDYQSRVYMPSESKNKKKTFPSLILTSSLTIFIKAVAKILLLITGLQIIYLKAS